MENLDAALKALHGGTPWKHITAHGVMYRVEKAFEAYHDKHEKPEPGYKLGAGCKVICEQRLEPEILTATVLSIDGGMCFLRYADGGQGCYPSSALTVTAPATPEVDDYVEIDRRDIRDTIFAVRTIKCLDGNVELWHIANREWTRDEFTIICKAKRG